MRFGCAAFGMSWDKMYKEFDNPHDVFVLYEYASDRVQGGDIHEARYTNETRGFYHSLHASCSTARGR